MEATAAAVRVAELLGADTDGPEVLHQSNNVVIRFADIVLKVSTDLAMAEREVLVASYVRATAFCISAGRWARSPKPQLP